MTLSGRRKKASSEHAEVDVMKSGVGKKEIVYSENNVMCAVIEVCI